MKMMGIFEFLIRPIISCRSQSVREFEDVVRQNVFGSLYLYSSAVLVAGHAIDLIHDQDVLTAHFLRGAYETHTDSHITQRAQSERNRLLPAGLEEPPLWCLLQLCSQRSSLLAQLWSPCWPITAFRERGRYLSTHSRLTSSPAADGDDFPGAEDDEEEEEEEERPSSRRAVGPEPLPGGVPPLLVLAPWPSARPVFDGLGVASLELALTGAVSFFGVRPITSSDVPPFLLLLFRALNGRTAEVVEYRGEVDFGVTGDLSAAFPGAVEGFGGDLSPSLTPGRALPAPGFAACLAEPFCLGLETFFKSLHRQKDEMRHEEKDEGRLKSNGEGSFRSDVEKSYWCTYNSCREKGDGVPEFDTSSMSLPSSTSSSFWETELQVDVVELPDEFSAGPLDSYCPPLQPHLDCEKDREEFSGQTAHELRLNTDSL
ncbi:hypothetical protein EYF80_020395 [Liparis tanakae]|uniref:Uncharacterized protein n=1 Tax=Liparis tanakae TaxID=230148 RepID=A0A4Z2HWL2_9TELE|nr:hypothetical protein EYF80_020395 [Liparis tanakae]